MPRRLPPGHMIRSQSHTYVRMCCNFISSVSHLYLYQTHRLLFPPSAWWPFSSAYLFIYLLFLFRFFQLYSRASHEWQCGGHGMNKNSQGLALWPYIEDRIKHLWMPGLIFLEWEINDVSVGRRKWLPNKEHVYMVTMTKKKIQKTIFFFHLSTCGFILFFLFCLLSSSLSFF